MLVREAGLHGPTAAIQELDLQIALAGLVVQTRANLEPVWPLAQRSVIRDVRIVEVPGRIAKYTPPGNLQRPRPTFDCTKQLGQLIGGNEVLAIDPGQKGSLFLKLHQPNRRHPFDNQERNQLAVWNPQDHADPAAARTSLTGSDEVFTGGSS